MKHLTFLLYSIIALVGFQTSSYAIMGGEELLRTSGVAPDSGADLSKDQVVSQETPLPLGTELALPPPPDLAAPAPEAGPEEIAPTA